MADVAITGLPATTPPLDGDELLEMVKDPSGVPTSESVTVADVRGDTGRVLGGSTTDTNSVAVGTNAATESNGTAVGIGATTDFWHGVAVGRSARGNSESVAVGSAANTVGGYAVAVGRSASANMNGVSVGRSASGGGTGNTAIGALAIAGSTNAKGFNVAVGGSAEASPTADNDSSAGCVAIGNGAKALFNGSVAIGRSSEATATFQVMVGPRDIEITGIAKGIVLVDRTLSTRHRVYLDNGALSIEAA